MARLRINTFWILPFVAQRVHRWKPHSRQEKVKKQRHKKLNQLKAQLTSLSLLCPYSFVSLHHGSSWFLNMNNETDQYQIVFSQPLLVHYSSDVELWDDATTLQYWSIRPTLSWMQYRVSTFPSTYSVHWLTCPRDWFIPISWRKAIQVSLPFCLSTVSSKRMKQVRAQMVNPCIMSSLIRNIKSALLQRGASKALWCHWLDVRWRKVIANILSLPCHIVCSLLTDIIVSYDLLNLFSQQKSIRMMVAVMIQFCPNLSPLCAVNIPHFLWWSACCSSRTSQLLWPQSILSPFTFLTVRSLGEQPSVHCECSRTQQKRLEPERACW